ncbi:hypothetical protein J1614_008804 [Plenodomus biglobosus]|nr:hypothetical protein J1614_008804 [Plenodomus biglobosus]
MNQMKRTTEHDYFLPRLWLSIHLSTITERKSFLDPSPRPPIPIPISSVLLLLAFIKFKSQPASQPRFTRFNEPPRPSHLGITTTSQA